MTKSESNELISGGIEDPLFNHLIKALDRSIKFDVLSAFVMKSGTNLIFEHLVDLIHRGGQINIVTGDYLYVTDPEALRYLLDLKDIADDGQVNLRIFQAKSISFHPKAYICQYPDGGGTAFVGSSNLSKTALKTGIEWNYCINKKENESAFEKILVKYSDLKSHGSTVPITYDWIEEYEEKRQVLKQTPIEIIEEKIDIPPTPHRIQIEALAALEKSREKGNSAGLVVLATGLGKTWLSAFDSSSTEFKKILFVAHRDEILSQAMETFRRVRPSAKFGKYNGIEKAPNSDILFASIQTLGRLPHLRNFSENEFDYIIMDEFHHACAKTYRNVIDYFNPKFLIGLTATPERMDGGDLLSLCQENLIYRCDVFRGIEEKLLCKFKYFGVPDEVDYSNIKWRTNRFDEEELTKALSTDKRAKNALEQYLKHKGKKAIGFCSSQKHADYMAMFFNKHDVKAVSVHSGPTSAPRAASLEKLNEGEINILFSVDMFNEGVDLPAIDTVMMLRPTESIVIWMQQFGRGLRVDKSKDHLRIIDYIGNHRIFLTKIQALFKLRSGDGEIYNILQNYKDGCLDLPNGCEVEYELEVIETIESLLRPRGAADLLTAFYDDFKQRHGVRPTAVETYHEGYNPNINHFESWFSFVGAQSDLSPTKRRVLEKHGQFISLLTKTSMTKSYKMLVLLGMLNQDSFPGQISIDDLVKQVIKIVKRNLFLQSDLAISVDDKNRVKKLLVEHPIDKWVQGKGMGDGKYFTFDGKLFSFQINVADDLRDDMQEMVREIVDFKLAKYLSREGVAESRSNLYICKVINTNDKPIIKLPDRESNILLPEGEMLVEIAGNEYMARFASIAINIVNIAGETENVLPNILRDWFGPEAGMPGTAHKVTIEIEENRISLSPFNEKSNDKKNTEIWRSFDRNEIPGLFGLEFNRGSWLQGYVKDGNHLFLLVTLQKSDMDEEHRYEDKFLDESTFQWQSQNSTTQKSGKGQVIKNHNDKGIQVSLFVRPSKKVQGKACKFTYCGEVDFVSWEGEKPITVIWKLRNSVPSHLRNLLKLS